MCLTKDAKTNSKHQKKIKNKTEIMTCHRNFYSQKTQVKEL